MRQINHYTGDSKAFLHSIGDGLYKENRTTYKSIAASLDAKYDEYDAHLGELEQIPPLWSEKTPQNEAQVNCAHDMYGRERKDISWLWEQLKTINGGKVFKCPLCGVRDVTDLDHYAPRSIFPEYSVHPKNLIPTCHECNKQKDNVWLTGRGHRIIYNAYFDRPLNILTAVNSEIKIDAHDLPYVKLSLQRLAKRPKGYGLMMRTLSQLELVPFYTDQVNNEFKTEFLKLSAHLTDPVIRNAFESFDVCWRARQNEYRACLFNPVIIGEVNVLLYYALMNSPLFDDWLRIRFQ